MKSASSIIIAALGILTLGLTGCSNPNLPAGSVSAGFSGTTKNGVTYYGNVTVPIRKEDGKTARNVTPAAQ